MQIRAVFTDLDGTLLLGDGTYTARTKDSINKLLENDILVAGITGKSYRNVSKIYSCLGMTSPGVFNGGVCVVDPATGTLLAQTLIGKRTLLEITSKIAQYCEYISFGSGRLLARDVATNIITDPTLSIWAEVRSRNVSKVIELCNQHKSLVAYINNIAPNTLVGVQINNRLADKEHGAMRLMKLLGLKPAEVVAVGNDYNDIPLFRAVGLSIAMGSAPKEVKSSADHSVADVIRNGFEEAVDRYVLFN